MAAEKPFLPAVARRLWTDGAAEPPFTAARACRRVLRVVYAIARGVSEGRLALRATSLVYTTLLSMVPMLAFSFSVLKGFGVHNQLEPALLGVLKPLGPQADEITARIIEFVDRVQVGVLGAVGLGVLVYTVVSLIEKVEAAFNELWCASECRPLRRRVPEYLTALLIGPVMMFSLVGGVAAVTQMTSDLGLNETPVLAATIHVLLGALPTVSLVLLFTFVYWWLPNRPVALEAAAIGGGTAAVLWLAGGALFGTFVASSTQYAAIYSAFADPLLFMIWLYTAWLIVLLGCGVAFYCQNPEAARHGRQPPAGAPRTMERLSLLVYREIAAAFHHGRPPPTADAITLAVHHPETLVRATLDQLKDRGLVVPTAGSGACYLPARPLESVPLGTVVDAIRGEPLPRSYDDRAVAPLEARIAQAIDHALAGMTARDLVEAVDIGAGCARPDAAPEQAAIGRDEPAPASDGRRTAP